MTDTVSVVQIVDEARRLLADYRAREDGGDHSVVHLPSTVLPELHRIAALSAESEVRQIVPFHADGWDVEAYEHLLWRQLATGDCRVTRVYISPHRGVASETLERQVQLDRSSGMQSHVTYVTALPEEMQGATIAGLWIIDNAGVITTVPSSEGFTGRWTVSSRATDINAALSTWGIVSGVSEDLLAAKSATGDLEEPLVLSADLVSNVADILCSGDHVSPDGCTWYHGTWQYLRLMDMVSTPTWHSDFYLESLSTILGAQATAKVLITGTADYSMFAYVDMAAVMADASPEITVVDLCATPLFACRWYGRRAGRPVSAVSEDVLAFAASDAQLESWDAIVTDAFLTRFSRDQTSEVAKAWHRLLRPGGQLITTIRIHTRTPHGRDENSAVRDFALRALKRAERWHSFLDRTPQEVATMAEAYARRMMSNNLGSETDVLAILETTGFKVANSAVAEVPGELHPTTYLEVTCIRQ